MAEEQVTSGAPESSVAEKGGSATTVSTLPGWTAGLSKEQKEAITSQKIQLPEKLTEFWDSHSQLEAKLKNAVLVPGKEDPPEAWSNYRKAIGVPESKDGYAFKKPELPEGMVYDDKLADSFAQWAHEEGLTVKAAQSLFNKFNAAQIERQKSMNAEGQKQASEMNATRTRELETARTELRKQWGDTYDARMPRNMNALQNPVMVPQSIVSQWDKGGALRNPEFHLWWDRQVSMMSSDRRLGIKGEESEATEEDNEQTVKDAAGNRHLKPGFFKNTEKRHPARRKAS